MSKHKPKKIKRESGRTYNKTYDPENGSYYMIYWNDWNDWRDGMRYYGSDSSKIYKVPRGGFNWSWVKENIRNEKNKKLLNRRKLRKITPT